jgi:hypothetical protein
MKRFAAGDDREGEFPAEVDSQRFGSRYRAAGREHVAVMYTVVSVLMLAAHESVRGQFSREERDICCAGFAGSAGAGARARPPRAI